MAQINQYNFLRWFDSNPTTAQPDLPYGYWKDREHCGYAPVAYPSETLSFYINTIEGLTYTNFLDLRLGVVKASTGQMVVSNVGNLQQHFLDAPDNTRYNIYCSFVLPLMQTGEHYLRIYRESTGEEVLRSSYLMARNDKSNLDKETVYCRFRHDRYYYGIKYHELEGFYQQFRLNMSVIDGNYESDMEVYKEITTGQTRTFNEYLGKVHKVETYYFDPAAHDAATIMFSHKYLELNGRQYTRKGTYELQNNPQTKMTKGTIEVYDEAFASANLC